MPMPNRLPAVEGDMVVTAVAGHYAIGCVTAECDTHLCLESSGRRVAGIVGLATGTVTIQRGSTVVKRRHLNAKGTMRRTLRAIRDANKLDSN